MLYHQICFIFLSFINLSCSSIIRIKNSHIKESNPFQRRSNDAVCQTEECAKFAQQLLDTMDENIKPCDDFYKFACGGYIAKNTIPEDKTSIGTYEDLFNENQAQLKALVEKPLTGSEPEFIKKIKNLYDTCVNLDNINAAGSEPLQKLLDTLGGWPVVLGDKWDGSKFDWIDTIHSFRRLGLNHGVLLSSKVSTDMKDSTVYALILDQPSLGLTSRSDFSKGLTEPATKAYLDLMVKSANKLGADQSTSEKEMTNVFNFEAALAKLLTSKNKRRDFSKLYHKYTIKELQELAPQIDWPKLINGLFEADISPIENVVVYAPDYMKKLGELLAATDKRIIANYMLWRAVQRSLPLLSKDWRDLKKEFDIAHTGSKAEKSRWEECLFSFYFKLDIGLSSYYVKNYFKEDSKRKADELVTYIRNVFHHMLEKIDWMDEVTKTAALEKAKGMTPYIGYPKELVNDNLVTNYYEKLSTTPDNYFTNVLNLNKWETDKEFSKLQTVNVKGDWKKHAFAALVNAYYNPQENSLDFPAGILLKPFFSKDFPNYLNYGGIGSIIGHEITHGFDDTGRQFDKDGNVKNWWSESTDEKFKQKAECIINQYGNFSIEGAQVNGVFTQGENIADNGGLKNAYLAYRSWVSNNAEEPKLPGLKYSPNQLFWLSNAYMYCGRDTPEYLKMAVRTDPHSPYEFRVTGPFRNLVEFSNDFQCAPGSPMNPDHKCEIW